MTDPKTVPELLDAAAAVDDNGEAFGRALMGLFSALEKARDEVNDDNELRTVIADLMDEHRHCCLRKSADMTDSILAAIREHHAIVRLPEPTHSGPVSTSWGLVTKWDRVRQTPGERRIVTIDPHDRGMTPESARALAAALLAAADAAEREQ